MIRMILSFKTFGGDEDGGAYDINDADAAADGHDRIGEDDVVNGNNKDRENDN